MLANNIVNTSLVSVPFEELQEEMDRMFSADRNQEQHCLRCNTTFIPPLWFFYGLCNDCFTLFDLQKMMGRMALVLKNKKIKGTTESCEQWIKEHPYVSKEADDRYFFDIQKLNDAVWEKLRTVH